MSAGCQMLAGGILLLACSGLTGEWQPLPHFTWRAIGALLYLIVAGSLAAYTAYMWLLGRFTATQVSSYAYVNPVIALALGYLLAGEPLSARTLAGAALANNAATNAQAVVLGGSGEAGATVTLFEWLCSATAVEMPPANCTTKVSGSLFSRYG